MKASKIRSLVKKGPRAGKKKCCKSKPRCKKCPVVISRVIKLNTELLTDDDLVKAFKKARKK